MRERLITAALVLAVSAAGCSRSAQHYFNSGNKYFDSKDYKSAVVQYRSAIAKNPRYGEARVYLGGPGVSITGEDALDIARELGDGRDASALVAVEANTIVAMAMQKIANDLFAASLLPNSSIGDHKLSAVCGQNQATVRATTKNKSEAISEYVR